MSSSSQWTIGQEVNVAPRTWPGINKPGGHGKIVKIHYSSLGVVDGLDVKYTLGRATDTNLEADLVSPHVDLDRGRRSRRGVDIMTVTPPAATKKTRDEEEKKRKGKETSRKTDKKQKKKAAAATKSTKENIPPASDEVAPKKKPAKKNGPVPSASDQKKKSDGQAKEPTPAEPTVPRLVVTKPVDSSVAVSPLASCTGNKNNKSKFRSILPASAKNQQKSANNTSRPAVAAATNANQGKLKRSYDDNLQEASCYIDSLVGTTTTAAVAVAKAPAAPRVKTASERSEEERRQQFGHLFSAAMRQYESEIPVDNFAEIINSSATSSGCKSFSRDEVQTYMDKLCDDGKAMESEGFYYEVI